MRYLLTICLLVASAYSYEARVFGQFGVVNTIQNTKVESPAPSKYASAYAPSSADTTSTSLNTSLLFKVGYEQNIINHHIIQAYYATHLTNQLLGVNYVYELPSRGGFWGFYGGIDLGAIPEGSLAKETTFDGHLNIGTRYRVKSAFIDFGLNTSFAKIKDTSASGFYSPSSPTTTTTFPFGFMLSVGLMLGL